MPIVMLIHVPVLMPCAALLLGHAAALSAAGGTDSLYGALTAVPFLNSGVTRSTDSFFFEEIDAIGEGQKLIYLEADNVSCVHCVWSDGGKYYIPHPYLFRANATTQQATSAAAPAAPSTFEELAPLDWTQKPIVRLGTENKQPSEAACKAQCASMPTCNVGLFLNGSVRHGECWLSTGLAEHPRNDFCGAKAGQSCAAFCKTGTKPSPGPAPPPPPPPPHPPGVYQGVSPASGMRSAVPLGGIGAGSFELRGDGSMHEFIIHNAGPGGAAKIQTYPAAFFGMEVDGESRVLRTHPPAGMQGVDGIRYSGTHPISRLQILNAAPEMEVALYGYSAFKVGDMPASGRPAAAFTLSVANSKSTARNVSFMMQLPLQSEEDQARPGTPLPGSPLTLATASACLSACERTQKCLSWTWTAVSSSCILQSDVPLNRYSRGVTSGVAGTWGPANSQQCLRLTRPGLGPMHGDASLCASASNPDHKWGWAAESDAISAFSRLSHTHTVQADTSISTAGQAAPHGAVSVSTVVPAGANATLTVTFGWNFPHRDMYNYDEKQAFVPFGNVYAKHYADSTASAWGAIAPGGERESALASVVSQASAVSHALRGSLPEWLTDLLANSLSHTRDSMWWQRCPHCHNSSDSRVAASSFGIWRQYEAYDCPDLDSIHNDGERHFPYIMFMTNGTRSKLAAWAGNQRADGMLAEQVLNSDPDSPQGRIMSDSSSMFILYVLELLRWGGDEESLRLYYPTVKRAAMWQMNRSAGFGVPEGLETTYDILKFPSYQLSTYASVFHLAAMRATEELARASGDTEFAAAAHSAFVVAQTAIDELQWNASLGFYNAASNSCTRGKGCDAGIGSFADAFYAQVLAYSLGLGDLLADPSRLDSHLAYTAKANCVHNEVGTGNLVHGCPNGLVIMTNRPIELTDLQIWEMATYDHVALALHRNQTEMSEALVLAEASGTSYSLRMNDQWNIAGIKSNE